MIWVPVVFAVLCWVLSLRRTPYAMVWLASLPLIGGAPVALVQGVEVEHHTLAGLTLAVVGACLPAAFCVLLTEVDADKEPIVGWRRDHLGPLRARRQRHAPKPPAWQVRTSTAKERVEVTRGLYGGQKEQLNVNRSLLVRVIGPGGAEVVIAAVDLTADDCDAQLQTAVALAEDRAQSLNALLGP